MVGRFVFGKGGDRLDVVPVDPSILGFENHWQAEGVQHAVPFELPSSRSIRVLPPPYLLATKLEAFAGRGRKDFLGGHDFEDVVLFVDGRDELPAEVHGADPEVRRYIASQVSAFLSDARALAAIAAHLETGGDGRSRAESVVIPRFERLASSG